MKDLVVGQILGRYELLVPIAKGGMAQVWAARLRGTRGFQKIVAVKTILAGAMDDERMEEMFLEEATLASQIEHPNVVGTIELGEEGGMLYLVMEWVEGESLNFIINRAAGRGGIPLPIAVNLIGQACKGLHAAHDLRDEAGNLVGLVHRDISAQNVLVAYTGNAKLVDFGIAKATARSSGLTEAGEIKGKFAYLAPEQALAQAVDRRTDVFSMGILLYFLTTGRHPFKGTSPGETLQKICSTEPTPPSRLVADFPSELEAVIARAMKKAPDERWATANEMLSALERAMPEAMDGSFEVKIADYLGQLLGNRARERRTELRLAQQMLDGSGAKTTGSSGSLRAILVDPNAPATMSLSPQREIVVELGSGAAVVEPKKDHPLKKHRARAVIAVTAAVALAGGIRVFGKGTPANETSLAGAVSSPVSAAASPVPAANPPPLPSPASPTAAEPPRATATLAPTVAPAEPANDKDGAKRGKKAPVAPPRASAAPPPPAPPAEKPRTETRDAASNAWDPGSFGGRR